MDREGQQEKEVYIQLGAQISTVADALRKRWVAGNVGDIWWIAWVFRYVILVSPLTGVAGLMGNSGLPQTRTESGFVLRYRWMAQKADWSFVLARYLLFVVTISP